MLFSRLLQALPRTYGDCSFQALLSTVARNGSASSGPAVSTSSLNEGHLAAILGAQVATHELRSQQIRSLLEERVESLLGGQGGRGSWRLDVPTLLRLPVSELQAACRQAGLPPSDSPRTMAAALHNLLLEDSPSSSSSSSSSAFAPGAPPKAISASSSAAKAQWPPAAGQHPPGGAHGDFRGPYDSTVSTSGTAVSERDLDELMSGELQIRLERVAASGAQAGLASSLSGMEGTWAGNLAAAGSDGAVAVGSSSSNITTRMSTMADDSSSTVEASTELIAGAGVSRGRRGEQRGLSGGPRGALAPSAYGNEPAAAATAGSRPLQAAASRRSEQGTGTTAATAAAGMADAPTATRRRSPLFRTDDLVGPPVPPTTAPAGTSHASRVLGGGGLGAGAVEREVREGGAASAQGGAPTAAGAAVRASQAMHFEVFRAVRRCLLRNGYSGKDPQQLASLLLLSRAQLVKLVQDFGEHSDAVWSVGASQGSLAARVMQLMTVQQPQQQQGPQQFLEHTQAPSTVAAPGNTGTAAPGGVAGLQHGDSVGDGVNEALGPGHGPGAEVIEEGGEEDDEEKLAFGDPRRRALLAEVRRRRELMERASRPEEIATWLVKARAQDVMLVRLPLGGPQQQQQQVHQSQHAGGRGGKEECVVLATAVSQRHAYACAEAVRYQIRQKLDQMQDDEETAAGLEAGHQQAGGAHAGGGARVGGGGGGGAGAGAGGAARGRVPPPPVSGASGGDWLTLEAGNVQVHVLTAEARNYFRLEELLAPGWRSQPRHPHPHPHARHQQQPHVPHSHQRTGGGVPWVPADGPAQRGWGQEAGSLGGGGGVGGANGAVVQVFRWEDVEGQQQVDTLQTARVEANLGAAPGMS